MDDHGLYQMLKASKAFLIKFKHTTFKSFDFTDSLEKIVGDSFRVKVASEEDVLYFLTFYGLDNNMSELDIRKMKIEKNLSGSFFLILQLKCVPHSL